METNRSDFCVFDKHFKKYEEGELKWIFGREEESEKDLG